jgi:hypothetical protein
VILRRAIPLRAIDPEASQERCWPLKDKVGDRKAWICLVMLNK